VYRQSMELATALLITEIFDENPNENLFAAFSGDVYFPEIDPSVWKETNATTRSYIAASKIPGYGSVKRKGLRFRVRRYIRLGANVAASARLTVQEVGAHLSVPKKTESEIPDSLQSDLFEN